MIYTHTNGQKNCSWYIMLLTLKYNWNLSIGNLSIPQMSAMKAYAFLTSALGGGE
jgi:hypothetical protein